MLNAFQYAQLQRSVSNETELISRLRKDIQSNQLNALDSFWEQVRKAKTPLVEALSNDSENVNCTFIFQGDKTTKSVAVNLPPYSRFSPESFQMTQIEKTDVWHVNVKLPTASRFVYSLVVDSPSQNVNSESPKEEIEAFRNSLKADELNPNRLNDLRSFVETPNAMPPKYIEQSANTPRGRVVQFHLESEILKNSRTISVYTPPNFDPLKTYPLLSLFDEDIYLNEIHVPIILDNLLAKNAIPPIVTVLVGNAKDRRQTELNCNPQFAEFIKSELFERIKNSYKISENPNDVIIGGASFGGLAAVFTALSFPETFGKILSQSGSFWKNPEVISEKLSHPQPDKQTFYLDAGLFEIEPKNNINLLEANRDLRNQLERNGHTIYYHEFRGGHGAINWRGTFGDALISLTKDLMNSPASRRKAELF